MEFFKQRQLIISYKRVFGTPEGKEVLFDLMNRFHILNPTGGDLLKEGQRSAVLHILRNTNISIEAFDALTKGDDNGATNGSASTTAELG